jgi:hypothetical protein
MNSSSTRACCAVRVDRQAGEEDRRADRGVREQHVDRGDDADDPAAAHAGLEPGGVQTDHVHGPTRHAVYLADMSKMPGFITRTFALPSLREQPFEVGVSLDGHTLADWPRQEDTVTLIRLAQGRVVSHEYLSTESQLKAALGL